MPNSYDIGDVVRCASTFTNADDVAVDPVTVRFKVFKPDGTWTTYVYGTDVGLIKDSTGHYHYDVEPEIEGVWVYRFEGVGSYKGAGESTFITRRTVFY